MAERLIDRAWIEAAIARPDRTEPAPRPGRTRSYRAIPEFGGRVLGLFSAAGAFGRACWSAATLHAAWLEQLPPSEDRNTVAASHRREAPVFMHAGENAGVDAEMHSMDLERPGGHSFSHPREGMQVGHREPDHFMLGARLPVLRLIAFHHLLAAGWPIEIQEPTKSDPLSETPCSIAFTPPQLAWPNTIRSGTFSTRTANSTAALVPWYAPSGA